MAVGSRLSRCLKRKSRLMMVGITVLVFYLILSFVWYGGHSEAASGHPFKTMTTGKLQKVAAMSDEREFRNILSNIIPVRVPGTQGHEDVKNYIIASMEKLKWDVELDTFTEDTVIGEMTFTNIVVTHNPAASQRLTLACHYDSKLFKNFAFHGMTDSAVPCSMMIDLANKLNSSIWNDRDSTGSAISLQLIFFDGEEAFVRWTKTDSIYGARHLAKVMSETRNQVLREVQKTDLEKMNVLVLLDLIGTSDTKFKSWFSNTKGLFERLKKTELRLADHNILEPSESFSTKQSKYFVGEGGTQGGIQDDHLPFLHRGVPVLHLIGYPFPSVWHKQSDNLSNMHYPTVKNIGTILRLFVIEYLRIKNP